jgi:hypothetical protein
MKRRRADWDFPYEPSPFLQPFSERDSIDMVVATQREVSVPVLREALRNLGPRLQVETLLARAPLYWTRVRSSAHATLLDVTSVLSGSGIPVRYVAWAGTGSASLPPPLDFSDAPPARASEWGSRRARPVPPASASCGHWFLRDQGGVRVDRRICGSGAGTRLAVIDDDAADLEHLDLDRTTMVGAERASAGTGHAALMTAWATGAGRSDGTRFVGVAPDASVRMYLIPKPGKDVVFMPLALAQAVFDGADVIVCATYVEGTASPLLDDALEVATNLGRRRRGTVVVLPTGRETSSPGRSVHASLSLGLGDPASDPRVHCVAPGGRLGGWFLWRTPRGKLRPFSNRGPAVRWLAPGDDIAYPFSSKDRLFHAESSGASAIAAGVLLLLLGRNPRLRLYEVEAILSRTVDAPDGEAVAETLLADPADVLPFGRDRDGHDAKCGYGRLNATRACACASDPVALELAAMGEDCAATTWSTRTDWPYSKRLARWAVRALLARPDVEHAARSVLRHIRLVSAEPSRAGAHDPGALARQLSLLARVLTRMRPPRLVRAELDGILAALSTPTKPFGTRLDKALLALFPPPSPENALDARHSSFSTARIQS